MIRSSRRVREPAHRPAKRRERQIASIRTGISNMTQSQFDAVLLKGQDKQRGRARILLRPNASILAVQTALNGSAV